jgi:hypothetical protein
MQPLFSNQQVAGGGNGQEFGNPFNNSEQDNNKPVWHRG